MARRAHEMGQSGSIQVVLGGLVLARRHLLLDGTASGQLRHGTPAPRFARRVGRVERCFTGSISLDAPRLGLVVGPLIVFRGGGSWRWRQERDGICDVPVDFVRDVQAQRLLRDPRK